MTVILGIIERIEDQFRKIQKRFHSQSNKRIPYVRIMKKLHEALKNNCDEIGRRVLIPNIFYLYFSPEDREARKPVEDILIEEIKEELKLRAKEWDPGVSADFFKISLNTDANLARGECRVECACQIPQYRNEVKVFEPAATLLEEIQNNKINSSYQRQSEEYHEQFESAKKAFIPLLDSPGEECDCRPWAPWKEQQAGCLVRISGPAKTESRIMPDGRWYIGRGKACEIALDSPDKKISRKHVEVEVLPGRIRLRALCLNRSFLNDRELPRGEWVNAAPGDCLRIEPYQLRWSMMRAPK